MPLKKAIPRAFLQKSLCMSHLQDLGFLVYASTNEVLQFQGTGNVNILFAQRTLSRKVLADAKTLPGMDFERIRQYADLFDEWVAIQQLQKGL